MAGTLPVYASSTPWIPEDDLLLKNSVEAGASLEALAKGAVQFSRGFTLCELRDRWHSLLYDPDISTQASSRMMELDLAGSNSSTKFSRPDNCKSGGIVSKRKNISIRRQYNAMRKRLRSELFNSNDIGFLEPNIRDCNGWASDFQEHVTLDNGHRDTNCMLRDRTSDHFGLQDPDLDILLQVFPQAAGDIGTTTVVDNPGNGYQTEFLNRIDGNSPITKLREDGLYDLPENIPPLTGEDGKGSIVSDLDKNNTLLMLPGDSANFENCTSNTPGPSQELLNNSHLEADDSVMKRLPAFLSVNENPQNMGSGFGGRHINSPESDGNASLHTMGFSSPMPRLPLWKTVEDISVPAMPVHMDDGDITHGVEEALTLTGNNEHSGESPARFDVVHSEPLLRDSDSGICFSSELISECEYVHLSDSLLNFPNDDELLFINVDGKDHMAECFYDNVNSLIISSPGDAQEGVSFDIQSSKLKNIEPIATLFSSTCVGTLSSSFSTEPNNNVSSLHNDGQQGILYSKINMASTSMLHPDSPQLNDETICCVFNTEDTEIPCNDDIFLLINPTTTSAPARKPFTIDPVEHASSADEKDNIGVNIMKKVNDPAEKYIWSSASVPNKLPESFPGLPVANCKLKSEIPDTKSFSLHPGEVSKTFRDLSRSRCPIATTCTSLEGVVKKDVIEVEPAVLDNPSASRELVLYAEAGSSALPEQVGDRSASDLDESESENDVPYFSDIEAMIIKMDLIPYDQDSYTARQVSKYQDEDAKKRIIRLEQCARSSLQRTMSSHSALAFLYGRHLKYYMKKTEVLLGRSTNDVDVDIDLRKEGRANKISRRQATIKMITDGAFLLKNLGKSLISVNGKAVASEQSLCLSSSSLIEIQGMSLVFEINHKYVRRYLDTITRKSQHNKSKFEWSPGQETRGKLLKGACFFSF